MKGGEGGRAENTPAGTVIKGKPETEVEQRLCDVPRTLFSDPVSLGTVDGCCVRRATQTLSWFRAHQLIGSFAGHVDEGHP